jgi:alpha-1,6-mannosyltransferase
MAPSVPSVTGRDSAAPGARPTLHTRASVFTLMVALIGLLAAGTDAPFGVTAVLLALSYAAFGVLVWVQRREDSLSPRLVLGLTLLLLVVAVVVPPLQSHDVWAYAMYGRIAAFHGASPYLQSPAAFPHDPLYLHVDTAWRHTRSVYGPLFTLLSAWGMRMAGSSLLASRLFFQCLTALCALGAVLLVGRQTRSGAAMALIGLNPLVIASVVNAGHNDALVGLAILGAVLLAQKGRIILAGAAVSAAILVKISAALALVALAAWVMHRWGWVRALKAAAAGFGVAAAGYLLAGGISVLGPLKKASTFISSGSFWSWGRNLWIAERVENGAHRYAASLFVRHELGSMAVLAVAAAAGLIVLARQSDRTAAIPAGASLLVYVLVAAYVLPWYLAWCLPALCLAWRSRHTLVALASGALLHLAYLPDYRLRLEREHHLPLVFTALDRVQMTLKSVTLPAFQAIAVFLLLWAASRRVLGSIARLRLRTGELRAD